jgi:hypothetical protein
MILRTSIGEHGALALTTIQTCPTLQTWKEGFDPVAQQNLRTLSLLQISFTRGNKMMIMMVKTIVLLLMWWRRVVTAIEDNVMEFGRFRTRSETESVWMDAEQ